MKPAIDIIRMEKCTGCFSSYDACPENVIIMEINEDGFIL